MASGAKRVKAPSRGMDIEYNWSDFLSPTMWQNYFSGKRKPPGAKRVKAKK